MRRPAATALAAAALACAAARPPTSAPAGSPASPAAAPAPQAGRPPPPAPAPGTTAAEVRAALGDPVRVERVDSAAAPGARYERWVYAGGREVVLLDGRVLDVLP